MKLNRGWLGTALCILGCCCCIATASFNAAYAEPTQGAAQPAEGSQQQAAAPPPAPTNQPSPEATEAEPVHTLSPSAQAQLMAHNQEVLHALNNPEFTYTPSGMTDPFVSFIAPKKSSAPEFRAGGDMDEMLPPERRRPLTPLEKMSQGEIESGFKAVLWGDMGRRALIEDKSGKGFLVNVGTSIGENSGVIAQIFEDRLVIQQEVWDPKLKRTVPQNVSVKLKKVETK